MYKTLRQISKNKKYDVIIVGSGPAGLAILDSLKDSSKRILVLEAGFKSFEEISQEIYSGETSGYPHGDIYLWRKRQLGGSSNCWGGGFIPFDEIDFLIESNGKKLWPITLEELKPFYKEAGIFYGVGDYYSIKNFPKIFKKEIPNIRQSYVLVNEKEKRFRFRIENIMNSSKNIDFCLQANVTDISFLKDNNRIEYLVVEDYSGLKKNLYADKYIIACGGIESTRLLLNWAEKYKHLDQIKNNLGHYYSPHINLNCGKIITSPNQILSTEYVNLTDEISCQGFFSYSFKQQEQNIYLNSKWHLLRESLKFSTKEYLKYIITGNMSYKQNIREITNKDKKVNRLLLDYLSANNETGEIYDLNICFDQTPTYSSSIKLTDKKDRFNLKRINLDFQISKDDIQKMKNTCTKVASLVGLKGIGRINIGDIDSYIQENELGFSHHTGTIRMSSDKSLGCVDKDLKIFGIDNLWVCSSAVFPTPSQASPTYTIMALAKRLSKNIKNEN